MPYTNILKTFTAVTVFSALALSLIIPAQNVYAQLQASGTGTIIQPSSQWMSAADSMTRSRFILSLKPGETVTRSVTISNLGNEEKRVLVSSEDRLSNVPDFTFSDNEELKEVGTWMKVEKTDFLVGSQKAVSTDFTITVPANTKPGEYAGVIAMEESPKDTDQKKSGFQLRSRVGTRVYITVPGDGLNYGVKFNDFEFISPKTKTYEDFVKGYYRQDPTVVHMNWTYQNTGKVFTKLKGKLTITTPNNEIKSDFDQDLNTFDQAIVQPGLPTEAKWVVGNYKAKFEFEVNPIHKANQDLKLADVSPTKVVETEFNMTQSDIDQIKKDFDALKSQRPEVNSELEKNKGFDNTTVKDTTPEVKKEDNTLYIILAAVGSLILAGLIGIIIFLLIKIKKDKEKEKLPEKTNSKKSVAKVKK